jgi:transporter family protein
MEGTQSSTWIFWALLSAVFAALTAIFAKIGLEDIDSDLATLFRTFVIIIVLGAFVYLAGKWTNPLQFSAGTLTMLGLSALATGASWICYFRALKIGDAAMVATIDKLSVVLVAVFAFIFLGERPSGWGWFGILLVGGGVGILAFKK